MNAKTGLPQSTIRIPEGFRSLDEILRDRVEIERKAKEHVGELFLIEAFHQRSVFRGIPYAVKRIFSCRVFMIGRVASSEEKRVSNPTSFSIVDYGIIPCAKCSCWDYLGDYSPFISLSQEYYGQILFGESEIENFLDNLSKDPMRGSPRAIVKFWEAARIIGEDISHMEPVKETLALARCEAIVQYVQYRIDLVASRPIALNNQEWNALQEALRGNIQAVIKDLLGLGLYNEEIKVLIRDRVNEIFLNEE